MYKRFAFLLLLCWLVISPAMAESCCRLPVSVSSTASDFKVNQSHSEGHSIHHMSVDQQSTELATALEKSIPSSQQGGSGCAHSPLMGAGCVAVCAMLYLNQTPSLGFIFIQPKTSTSFFGSSLYISPWLAAVEKPPMSAA
jgi:hypothetical protein